MKPLINHLTEARNVAASHEGDIRIKEFLRAMTIRQDGGGAEPLTLEVACHFRSWQKTISANDIGDLGEMPLAELAGVVAEWVQGAINQDLLSLSDPPRGGQREICSVGGVVTFTYDKGGWLVGKRWG